MSNPFPGMDPYLEGPLWSVVHHNLIEEFARQLTPKLRPKYRARTEERIVVAAPDPIEVGSGYGSGFRTYPLWRPNHGSAADRRPLW